jgi:hypothetical protein
MHNTYLGYIIILKIYNLLYILYQIIDKFQRLSSHIILLLQVLCHAIRADCLLIEAACAHAVNKQWAWWMVDKFVCMFKCAR